MTEWYQSLAASQKIFLFCVSVASSFILIGIPLLLFLIYMEIGNRTVPFFDGVDGRGTFHEYRVDITKGLDDIEESAESLKDYLSRVWKLDADLAHHLATFELFKLIHGKPEASGSQTSGDSEPPFIQSKWYKQLAQDLWGYPGGFFSYRGSLKVTSGRASYCLRELRNRQPNSKVDVWYREDVSYIQKIFLFATAIASSFILIGIPFLVLLIYLELGRLSLDAFSSKVGPLEVQGCEFVFGTGAEFFESPVDAHVRRHGEPNIAKQPAGEREDARRSYALERMNRELGL